MEELPLISLRLHTPTMLRNILFRFIIVALLAHACLGKLYAHDFWIEPTSFRPVEGAVVPLLLRVGQDLSGERLPYIDDWFSDYRVVSPSGARPIEGLMGDDPAGSFRAQEPGVYLVGYRSTRDFVELEPEKFDSYLEKEGLLHIAALRAERGESTLPAREYYSRCAKSLLEVGTEGPMQVFDTALGYTLELIPEKNPYALLPGDELPIRLLYRDAPIQGILVIAVTANDKGQKVSARTDANGRVSLPLGRPGLWLIKAVHMIETPPEAAGADWESFWASLTFQLSDPGS